MKYLKHALIALVAVLGLTACQPTGDDGYSSGGYYDHYHHYHTYYHHTVVHQHIVHVYHH